nr:MULTISPECIES: aspartyl-phosphate phosphatase Spo0E family protein [Clostridium]
MIKNTFVVNTNHGGVSMSELEDLLKDIDILRAQLEELINKKQGNLVDSEVVTASKILNAALNQYNKFIDEKLKKK